ncbi:hypothetical protein M3Y98_01120200 [Aphelenchoides besseyi]|nr:hypothetical protein M3Y98_01120200 [Aphelenchoides besseyi]KAI6210480.1 hypothetical protein M3Y96_00332800 [Aphelenchoides besseyi]
MQRVYCNVLDNKPMQTEEKPSTSRPTQNEKKNEKLTENEFEAPKFEMRDVPIERLNPLASPTHLAPLIQGSIPKEKAIKTHTNLHNLSAEKEEQIRRLYERLDYDNDGTVNILDLSMALKREVPHIPSGLAPKIVQRISKDNSDEINLSEFIQYVVEHEKRLEFIFKDLDRNQDGFIDENEIKNYCTQMGVPITDAKAEYLVQTMGQSNNSSICLDEFKQFMLFYPSSDPKDMAQFWRHNLVIDLGEDSQIPEDFSAHEMETGIWWRHLVAGGVAGCMSRTCTAPLDRLKVFLQVNSSKKRPFGVVGGIKYLYNEGGFKSFWRGNGINVVKIAPESAFKFMAYEQVKRLIQRFKGSNELSIYERFLAGSAAGAISQTLIYPLEVLKTRLALRRTGDMSKGFIHFAHEMYKNEGWICFYKGYVPNLLGILPYAGLDLAVYETLKSLYLKRNPEVSEPGVLALLACGACSSTCGQCVSYPLALIRTRLQARSISHDKAQPDTMVGQLKYILKNEGPTGLYRGIAPNFMKVIPAVSISYIVYERVRKQLGARMS